MTEFFAKRYGPALQPVDDEGREIVQGIGRDEQVKVKISRPRNVGHHKKLFVLFRFTFDHWQPKTNPEWKPKYGMEPLKDFENFWKDMMVLGGHYELVITTEGKLRKRPKSISFASMDQVEFDEVYKSMLTVAWELVFQHIDNYEDEQVLANALLEFE